MHQALTSLETTLQVLSSRLRSAKITMATAESCTGGGVAQACTGLAGSSDWFECAFVTYSNAAKTRMVAVPAELIVAHGAVSEAVARAMVEGALAHSQAGAALSITGVAGPGGGSIEKPVGTVWFAWAVAGRLTRSECICFSGDRAAVREQAVLKALQGLSSALI